MKGMHFKSDPAHAGTLAIARAGLKLEAYMHDVATRTQGGRNKVARNELGARRPDDTDDGDDERDEREEYYYYGNDGNVEEDDEVAREKRKDDKAPRSGEKNSMGLSFNETENFKEASRRRRSKSEEESLTSHTLSSTSSFESSLSSLTEETSDSLITKKLRVSLLLSQMLPLRSSSTPAFHTLSKEIRSIKAEAIHPSSTSSSWTPSSSNLPSITSFLSPVNSFPPTGRTDSISGVTDGSYHSADVIPETVVAIPATGLLDTSDSFPTETQVTSTPATVRPRTSSGLLRVIHRDAIQRSSGVDNDGEENDSVGKDETINDNADPSDKRKMKPMPDKKELKGRYKTKTEISEQESHGDITTNHKTSEKNSNEEMAENEDFSGVWKDAVTTNGGVSLDKKKTVDGWTKVAEREPIKKREMARNRGIIASGRKVVAGKRNKITEDTNGISRDSASRGAEMADINGESAGKTGDNSVIGNTATKTDKEFSGGGGGSGSGEMTQGNGQESHDGGDSMRSGLALIAGDGLNAAQSDIEGIRANVDREKHEGGGGSGTGEENRGDGGGAGSHVSVEAETKKRERRSTRCGTWNCCSESCGKCAAAYLSFQGFLNRVAIRAEGGKEMDGAEQGRWINLLE